MASKQLRARVVKDRSQKLESAFIVRDPIAPGFNRRVVAANEDAVIRKLAKEFPNADYAFAYSFIIESE